MNSESFAKALGGIIAAVVLAAAIFYGPIGQFGRAPKPVQQAAQPVPTTPTMGTAVPGARGPVVREVPTK